jgi:Streptomyces sporulation and cell division protein, SsgA
MSGAHDAAPLTAQLSARVLRPGSGSVAARIHLTYEPADPYAVLMEIRLPGGEAVNWMFGRELLAEGTHIPAGIGDVTVQPCPEAPSDLLHMTLRNEASDAVMEMRLAPIDEFLRSSYGLVPAGREGTFLEVDDDVRAIAS